MLNLFLMSLSIILGCIVILINYYRLQKIRKAINQINMEREELLRDMEVLLGIRNTQQRNHAVAYTWGNYISSHQRIGIHKHLKKQQEAHRLQLKKRNRNFKYNEKKLEKDTYQHNLEAFINNAN